MSFVTKAPHTWPQVVQEALLEAARSRPAALLLWWLDGELSSFSVCKNGLQVLQEEDLSTPETEEKNYSWFYLRNEIKLYIEYIQFKLKIN